MPAYLFFVVRNLYLMCIIRSDLCGCPLCFKLYWCTLLSKWIDFLYILYSLKVLSSRQRRPRRHYELSEQIHEHCYTLMKSSSHFNFRFYSLSEWCFLVALIILMWYFHLQNKYIFQTLYVVRSEKWTFFVKVMLNLGRRTSLTLMNARFVVRCTL